MTCVILQILGTNDINFGTNLASCKLKEGNVNSLESLKDEAEYISEEWISNKLDEVKFPLIEKLINELNEQKSDILFAIILTNQEEWIKENDKPDDYWRLYATSDGIWWKKVLSTWCKEKDIRHYSIILNISPNIPDGPADWEGMAKSVDILLNKYFSFKDGDLIYFQPPEQNEIRIDKILVQHSSGTPALSGALYLWGIEKKLAIKDGVNNKIEFVHINPDEQPSSPHSGNHWQWRLKDPQIRELLKIQDFSGALQLLDRQHKNYEKLNNNLDFLDKSVSLNLDSSLENRNSHQARDSVIQRISIAVWSERAFRERRQWMHWYLRIAGALELALLLLVEAQGAGDYQWQQQPSLLEKQNLVYIVSCSEEFKVNKVSIEKIVNVFLTKGELRIDRNISINPISDIRWSKFKDFYTVNWLLAENPPEKLAFITGRNNLYHSLIGDSIDQLLNKKTDELGKVTHSDHPSQIAITWLEYIIDLAGLSHEIKMRAKDYENKVLETIKLI